MLYIDLKLLDKQIKDLSKSNIKEASKEGLHNLLCSLYEELRATDRCIAVIGKERKK